MKRITEKELKEALLDAVREETAQIESAGEIPVPASLVAATDAMVARDQAAARRRRSLRRVIAAGLAAALLFVFFVVPVSAGGKTAAGFLFDVLEKHTFFYAKPNGQNVPDRIETFYTVDVPEEYAPFRKQLFLPPEEIVPFSPDSVNLEWESEKGMIAFSQSLIGGSDTMDSENAYHEVIDWNGYSVYYYYKWGQSYALWLTEEYKFFLIADNTDKEAFFAIMDTIREMTPEEVDALERVYPT
ncbi:MAG: hypothetical protein IJR89_05040 [Clostridia bacterium]|nr:hypothetical protein [Clostridia bacterium]